MEIKVYVSGDFVTFRCPGCKRTHPILVHGLEAWDWNGSLESPTFTPSILSYRDEGVTLCHSYVTDGKIKFLDDCKHELRGQTVTLPDW